jgi:hypothetical protein
MRSRHIPTLLALAFTATLAASAVSAQDPYADYNRARAYRHYLTSPYSFRTYSDLQSGRTWSYDTPLESGRFWQTPGYYHEEISPTGRWSAAVPPRVEGYVVARPVVIYAPVWNPAYPYGPPR